MEKISNLFEKINPNLIGYIITFLDHKEVIITSTINRRFKKALNSESLWESLILQNELFIQNDKESFTSWKRLYFTLFKLKSNIMGGKPNVGFKMKPMRGHKEIVTCMIVYEKSTLDYILISGDKNGCVLCWIKNCEDVYEGTEIKKCDSEIIDMKIINYNDNENFIRSLAEKFKCENGKSLMIVTTKNSTYSKIIHEINITYYCF